MRLYVYCLCDAGETPDLRRVAGLAAACPRVLRYGDVAAVVSDLSAPEVKPSRETVFAHQRVVQRVLESTTPLPFRFGAVTSPEQLEAYVAAERERLRVALAAVRGCVEMSVKVIADASGPVPEAPAPEADPSPAAIGPGTRFLLARRRELHSAERQLARCEELAQWLADEVRDVARDASVRVHAPEKLVSAAHLVERARLEEYRERMRRLREARADLSFLSSGPWAPYSFTDGNAARP